MRVLVSGASGLIGRTLVAARRSAGDLVTPLVRGGKAWGAVKWRDDGTLDSAAVSGFDAVVHLAGEPVAEGRWTTAKKERIRSSRVEGTEQLVKALRAAQEPPRVLVCASGINFYGDSGDTVLDESCPEGAGFLAEVCGAWEAAAEGLAVVARVVRLRIGAVLTPEGGILQQMLPLFRAGLAGPIAGGQPWVSWVTLEDCVRAIGFVLEREALRGPVNVSAPEPVRGGEFAREIAASVGRPAVVPVPAWAARLMLGEVANETVLASVRAVPRRLLEAGFTFEQPSLAQALTKFALRG